MTTYSSVSNAALAVGAIPSSSVVTALRDNPIAMAEAASGAPVNVMGWHPVDKVTVGDGKQGVIYDVAVNSTVSQVETPEFEDGYEYRIIVSGLSHTSGASRNFRVQLYGVTSGSYATVYTAATAITSAQKVSAEIEIPVPRLIKDYQLIRAMVSSNGTIDANSIGQLSSGQKYLKAAVGFSVGEVDDGKVWLFRRREFASAD